MNHQIPLRIGVGMLVLIGPALANTSPAPVQTSVCQLAKAPKAVSLSAIAARDPRHGVAFLDAHCRGQRVTFRFADHLSPTSNAGRFEAAITPRSPDLSLRLFQAEGASGKFGPSAGEHRMLVVDHVDRFEKLSEWPVEFTSSSP